MSSTTKHWGEMPTKMEESVPDVSADIDKSMNKFFLNGFEDTDMEDAQGVEQIDVKTSNPYVSFAIDLHKHINLIQDLMNNRVNSKLSPQQIKEQNVAVPEIPVFPKHRGFDTDIPDLSNAVVKQVLRKSLATLFAQIGFETCQESCLDVLTDVVDKFYSKICHSLKTAIEYDENHISKGFPNPVERVLTEAGLGGVKGVSDYYQKRVINYVNVLHERCTQLNQEYQSPKSPKTLPVTENVEVANTEVHISASDVNLSILEAGYQLLNSFEAVTNL